jgi:hypothetical protein
LGKIAENCDHNIDNRLGKFYRVIVDKLLALFHYKSDPNFCAAFCHGKSYASILTKTGLGYILGYFFTKSSGNPDCREIAVTWYRLLLPHVWTSLRWDAVGPLPGAKGD